MCAMSNKLELNGMTLQELENLFLSLDEKKFRAKQLFGFIHKNLVTNLQDVTVFSKELRESLAQFADFYTLEIEKRLDSKLDATKKYLLRLKDGNIIEAVYMESYANNTICISTQVGCRMGCEFCASTKNGFIRNLSVAELLEQIYTVERDLDKRIDNIVLMGIGEPFDNYTNVMKFIRLINHEDGHNTGIRNITVSTSGIISGIKKLTDSKLQVNLAISLHNPIQEEREQIMPIAKANPLSELREALKEYQRTLNRRISFEYVVLPGENDSMEHVKGIRNLAQGLDVHLNLIPLNPIAEYQRARGDERSIPTFKEKLERFGLAVTVRRKQGIDIEAACGQLRNKYEAYTR
ncbi:MAG: 23S rRNA (adenine(2503)-C(2))-methyltransferase RlmN [Tissierellia bacterium]|nr:23S rRNA (adenine(2503)-C(2))-methyltransferase RlmN [Tissierellia bacterium]